MRNLRNRVSAFALAVVMASGMATMFSANVSAFDGTFTPPSNEQICGALAEAAANVSLAPAYVQPFLLKAIALAQTKYGC